MRSLPTAVASRMAAREPMLTEVLVWLGGRDRNTGELEYIGLWTGSDHERVSAGTEERTYYGAGSLIGMEPITQRAGIEVRQHRITISPLSDEAVQAIRIYDPRLCPIEIHEWYFDPSTMTALAPPVRVFRGNIVSAPITTPAIGGEATCDITATSDAWALTRPLTLKRSNAALQERNPGDTFRQYGDISGAVETAWGERIGKPAQSSSISFPTFFGRRE